MKQSLPHGTDNKPGIHSKHPKSHKFSNSKITCLVITIAIANSITQLNKIHTGLRWKRLSKQNSTTSEIDNEHTATILIWTMWRVTNSFNNCQWKLRLSLQENKEREKKCSNNERAKTLRSMLTFQLANTWARQKIAQKLSKAKKREILKTKPVKTKHAAQSPTEPPPQSTNN